MGIFLETISVTTPQTFSTPAAPLSAGPLSLCSDGSLSKQLQERLGPNERTLIHLANPVRDLRICGGTDWAEVDARAQSLGIVERLGSKAEELSAAGIPRAWLESWVHARRVRAACNLLLAREETDLLKALQGSGIEVIPLKGVSLARVLYRDLSLRPVTDIDLGIRLGQLARAADILEQRGYTISLPRQLLRDFAFLRSTDEHTAELTCVREQAGFHLLVELHWKVLPLPDDFIWFSLVEYGETSVPEPPVRTLAPDLYLLYLCAHVSGHGWTSLRWLCDVAEFLLRFAQRIDPAQFLRHCAVTWLCHRVGSTLELIEAYFGLRWGPVDLLRNSSTRRTAEEFLLRPLTSALDISVGAVHRERLRLQDNARERLRYLWRLAHPTRTELLGRNGVLRGRPRAWVLRAARLVQLAWNESLSHRRQALQAGIPIQRDGTAA